MGIYKQMYLLLFNAVTDALEAMEENSAAAVRLRQAQQRCEELFIQQGEAE